jgi:hypothetical protein
MPYFNNNNINILFIHIPKTGGTSLEAYFSKKYDVVLDNKTLFDFFDSENQKSKNIYTTLQHMTYQTIMMHKEFFNIKMDNLEIITIVRNPYERIISDLFWCKKININSTKEEVYHIILEYLYDNNLDNHNIPQYLFLTDNNKRLIPNIKILHTETLTKDMKNLGNHDFNVKINTNKNKINYFNYLNQNSIKLINQFYSYDFEFFNYKKIIAMRRK